eukprot:scaffold310398_cov27-Tisochrysis_lutea.AAC.1
MTRARGDPSPVTLTVYSYSYSLPPWGWGGVDAGVWGVGQDDEGRLSTSHATSYGATRHRAVRRTGTGEGQGKGQGQHQGEDEDTRIRGEPGWDNRQ